MADFDRLRSQARTQQDFAELSAWCAKRARGYEAKRARMLAGAGELSPLEQAEAAEHCTKLALHWDELAELYAESARAFGPGH